MTGKLYEDCVTRADWVSLSLGLAGVQQLAAGLHIVLTRLGSAGRPPEKGAAHSIHGNTLTGWGDAIMACGQSCVRGGWGKQGDTQVILACLLV